MARALDDDVGAVLGGPDLDQIDRDEARFGVGGFNARLPNAAIDEPPPPFASAARIANSAIVPARLPLRS